MSTAPTAPVSTVPPAALSGFRERFRGELLEPGIGAYEEARTIWNGAIDRKPGLIARCRDASDVAAAVRLAADHDLLTSVRSGGHGVGGLALCDHGLVIDLSAMRRIEVDPRARTVRVEAGVLLGELDRATQAHGLAVPSGIVTHTGVAGLTLGGGIGWLMRKHGLTADHLLAAEVVLADATRVRATREEHPELFWALRGGGGNFGVVTSFLFRAHEIGPVVPAGPLLFPIERAEEVMGFYRDWAHQTPDELTTILNFRKAPPSSWVPEHLHGVPVLLLVACWSGDPQAADRALAPLKGLRPVLDLCTPRPFPEHQSFFDASVPPGWHYYWKSVEIPEMSEGVVASIVRHTEEATSPRSYTVVFQLGGAVARVGERESAYPRREAGYDVNINGVWLPEESDRALEHTRWVRSLFREVEPNARGVYVNFLGEEGRDRVRAAYGDEKYERLSRIKARYDPTNLFHLNQNIRPGE